MRSFRARARTVRHEPVWSPSGQYIAFVADLADIDIFRVERRRHEPDQAHRPRTNSTTLASTGRPNAREDRVRCATRSPRQTSGQWIRTDESGAIRSRIRLRTRTVGVLHPTATKIVFSSTTAPRSASTRRPATGGPETFLTRGDHIPTGSPSPINSYPRPKGATPFCASLAIAYKPVHRAGPNPRPAARLPVVRESPEDLGSPNRRHRRLQRHAALATRATCARHGRRRARAAPTTRT